MRSAALVACLALAACSGAPERTANLQAPQDLESAAIERGLVPDPHGSDLSGVYAWDGGRACIVPGREDGYRIGAFIDLGDRMGCSGGGRASRTGAVLHVELGDAGCGFDARLDGERIAFPDALPQACESLCSGRASFAGTQAVRLSDAIAEARALRDPQGRLLCASN